MGRGEMRLPTIGLVRVAALGALLVPGGSAPARAADSAWTVSQGDVRITVPLRPGGAFEAKSTALSGTLRLTAVGPAQLAGELALDLTTIDTGIDLRNKHLRENYLEVAKGAGYDKAVLSEIRLADVASEDFAGRTRFAGTLRLHNVSKPVEGSAEIRRAEGRVDVSATFPVVLTDFAIEPPQYMGVGVGNRLHVKVSFGARGGTR